MSSQNSLQKLVFDASVAEMLNAEKQLTNTFIDLIIGFSQLWSDALKTNSQFNISVNELCYYVHSQPITRSFFRFEMEDINRIENLNGTKCRICETLVIQPSCESFNQ